MCKLSILLFLVISLLTNLSVVKSCENIVEVKMSESVKPNHLVKDLKKIIQNFENDDEKFNKLHLTNFYDYFLVKNYQVWLQKSIDRELVCSNNDRHQMNINRKCCQGDCCLFIGLSVDNEIKPRKFYLKIILVNENDNKPQFNDAVVMLSITENVEVNTKINLPIATDLDDGVYGVQDYNIENDNPKLLTYFRLEVQHNSNKKERRPILIVKQEIDREKLQRFSFTLVAIDGGRPALKGRTKVIINILDENDNSPEFDRQSYLFSVKENQPIGSEVAQFKVIDKDFENNGKVTVDFVNSQIDRSVLRHFQLTNTKHGAWLRLISSLDYEKQTKFSFYIIAKDHGYPMKTSQVIVEIDIVNVNDVGPSIEFFRNGRPINSVQYGRINIDEGDNKDQMLCVVKVSDLDSPTDTLKCELDLTDQEKFYLNEIKVNKLLENQQSFELRSKINFDRENQDHFYVGIKCADSNGLDQITSSSKLEIAINDCNDNPPQFSNSQYFGFVKENRQNELVTIESKPIRAIDNDKGENGTVKYEISKLSDENFKDYFEIDKNTGAISVLLALDYEKVKQIKLWLIASDFGQPSLSSETQVTVNVVDVNDNPPEFDKSFYTFEIYENEPIGVFVGFINVSDKDTELTNKKVHLKIKNTPLIMQHQNVNANYDMINSEKLFTIDSGSGRIFTNAKLDREKSGLISFSVLAYNSNPLDSSLITMQHQHQQRFRDTVETSVTITILDRNDNKPRIVLRENTQIQAKNPEVTFNIESHSNSYDDKCIPFPYIFTDADRGDYSNGVRASIRNPKYFQLNMDLGTICIIDKIPPKDVYRIIINAEDGDVNETKNHEFILSINVKDSANVFLNSGRDGIGSDKNLGHRYNGGSGNDNSPGGEGNSYGNNGREYSDSNGGGSKYLRNKILYIIIGSIAAALLLLLIVILVGFKKFVGIESNYPAKPVIRNQTQMMDPTERQDLFEVNSNMKYADSSLLKQKMTARYLDKIHSELDSKHFLESDPSLQTVLVQHRDPSNNIQSNFTLTSVSHQNNNNNTNNINVNNPNLMSYPSMNYQTITNNLMTPDSMGNLYNSYNNLRINTNNDEMVQKMSQPINDINEPLIAPTSTIVSIHDPNQNLTNSKSIKSIPNNAFQSTFV